MLLNGDVDFSAVFTVTSYANLLGMKLDPLKDLRWFYFSDYGIDLYSNGIMVSKKLADGEAEGGCRSRQGAQPRPDRSRGQSERGGRCHDEGRAADERGMEKQRLIYALKTHFVSPETNANGLGDVSEARMAKAIALLAETYKLPNKPAVKDVFDRSFLPPKDSRVLKLSSSM